MVKLESLKKSIQFKKALNEKKNSYRLFFYLRGKKFLKPKYKDNLLISFVIKKKSEMQLKETK